MKKILLTGGGTAGHVTPNIALLDRIKSEGYDIFYIGSEDGIEKKLIEDQGIRYYPIATGKLRRYHSWKNFTDPFRVVKGYFQARKIIKTEAPDVCFSKGGFVSVPVVRAAKSKHVPVIIHESDMTPGLANKIAMSAAKKVCCNFPETLEHIKKGKGVHSGTPIRKELFTGSREAGLKFAGLTGEKPVILVVGGSTGALSVNKAIWGSIDKLLEKYEIIHLCGKDKRNPDCDGKPGYFQLEYCDREMKDAFAAADIVVSRAGANAIFELLALKKPNILIPLGLNQSRGDQIMNAKSFEKQGFSLVLQNDEVTEDTLLAALDKVLANKETYIRNMEEAKINNAEDTIINLIKTYS